LSATSLETGYAKVANKSESPDGKMKKFQLNGKEVIVPKIEGKYYAIAAKCTHHNGELSQGSLEGAVVTCPNHKAKFDVVSCNVSLLQKSAFSTQK
jgi:3-phenylpropionate/trans-cinnamate dioxygenase ferredoxin subunit